MAYIISAQIPQARIQSMAFANSRESEKCSLVEFLGEKGKWFGEH